MANVRSITAIGNLWPRCANCNHIAQMHENDGCAEMITGQCPTCKTGGVKVKCSCLSYIGPTWEEFKRLYLTPEEIAFYKWEGDRK